MILLFLGLIAGVIYIIYANKIKIVNELGGLFLLVSIAAMIVSGYKEVDFGVFFLSFGLLVFFVTDEVIFDLTEYKTGYDSTEYYNTIYIVLYTIGSTMTLYGVFHFFTKFTPKFLDDFCYKTSAAVNEIYIISWLIIYNVFFVIFGLIFPSA